MTEKVKAEKELQWNLSLLKSTMEATVDGIVAVDNNWGKISTYNKSFLEIWNIPEEVKSISNNFIFNFMLEQLKNPNLFLNEVKYLSEEPEKDSYGTIEFNDGRLFEKYSKPQRIDDEIVGRVWSFRDITEEKRAKEKLKQSIEALKNSNKELEQFAYVASHDLQEPLRMVTSYMNLLEEEYVNQLEGDAKIYIDFAVNGAKRMKAMINDLLKYSRIQTHKGSFEYCSLKEIIDEVLEDLEFLINETNSKIITDDLLTIKGDKNQLRQVFQNLIMNAIEHSDKSEPIVKISSYDDEDIFHIVIEDNGSGIKTDDFTKIFDIFYSKPKSNNKKGTGIGLSICKRIIERHNGKIWVESYIGKGTAFHFTISKIL